MHPVIVATYIKNISNSSAIQIANFPNFQRKISDNSTYQSHLAIQYKTVKEKELHDRINDIVKKGERIKKEFGKKVQ